MEQALTEQFLGVRRELGAYLCRLVVRPQVAEELVQTTYLRCLEARERLPTSNEGIRAWLFKVGSNLAFDELRRHANWREDMLGDLRELALTHAEFVQQSKALASTPETRAIAREHLVTCLGCTLRNLPQRKAAALLLKEVHGFGLDEVAELLDATPAQAKNWLQEARAHLTQRYGATCALLVKEGVCHQCIELDGFLGAGQGSPLAGDTGLDARLRVAAELRDHTAGPWHRLMFELMDELA
jgi:RNA polymerase sigma-70 factor (ECF subfamily)